MTRKEQKKFIGALLNGMKGTLTRMVDNESIPEDWDGLELRLLIADYAKRNADFSISKDRKKAFDNEVLVRNL